MVQQRSVWGVVLAVSVLFAGSLLFSVNDTHAQQIKGRIGVIYKEGQPTSLMWNRYADLIRERTKGQVDLKVYSGGQLGGEREVAEGLRLGSIQGMDITLAALSSWVPEGQLFDLPFLFRDLEHIEAVTSGPIGEELKAKCKPQGFEAVGFIVHGTRNIVSRIPIHTPSDAKGKKIRVIPSPTHMAIWKQVGGNPTAIPITETYAALSTGVVDFMDFTKDGFESMRFYEVAPYFVETGHMWAVGINIWSNSFWQSLSPEQRKIFHTTGKEMSAYFNRIQKEEVDKALARTVQKGAKVVQVDKKLWSEAMRPLWEREAPKFGGMDKIMSIVNTK